MIAAPRSEFPYIAGGDGFRHTVMESNESQTGSGFIPALSNNVTAGELTVYHTLLSFCRNIIQYYEYLHHLLSSSSL